MKLIDSWSRVPATEAEARQLGCICDWVFKGAIIRYNPACPIGHRHAGRETPQASDTPGG
jgi:hypothetical protein